MATFTPGSDFEDIVDGLEPVTLKRRGSSDVSVSHALQRAVDTSEVEASDGRYLSGDVRWHFPVAEVSSRPTPGDDVVDGNSVYWKVIDVQEAALSRRWRCVCRNLSVAFGLDDFVKIEQAAYSKGTGGAAEDNWKTLLTGLRARIQPGAFSALVDQGARRTERLYTIYIGEDLPRENLDEIHSLRVVDKQGNNYRIISYSAMERIGELAQLEVAAWR